MAQIHSHPIRSRFPWRRLLPALLCWLVLPLPGYGQSQELYLDRGAVGLSQSLKRLPLISRVLFIMAHPDDEPAGLVTFVSRGAGARTAILSLTRGEGGQNLVGPDLFEALGLVRTGEMLAANEFYGASQYFSRAFDFGFSKSPQETLDKWGRQRILEDLVRTIRSFRPLVILSVFDGTPADGHGHHQACGLLAREAFEISGDPDRFPELTRQGLGPWKAARLYLRNRGEDPPGSFSIDTGAYDPWLGASFRQVGAQGYSRHRSQGMGRAHALPGSHIVKLRPGGNLALRSSFRLFRGLLRGGPGTEAARAGPTVARRFGRACQPGSGAAGAGRNRREGPQDLLPFGPLRLHAGAEHGVEALARDPAGLDRLREGVFGLPGSGFLPERKGKRYFAGYPSRRRPVSGSLQ